MSRSQRPHELGDYSQSVLPDWLNSASSTNNTYPPNMQMGMLSTKDEGLGLGDEYLDLIGFPLSSSHSMSTPPNLEESGGGSPWPSAFLAEEMRQPWQSYQNSSTSTSFMMNSVFPPNPPNSQYGNSNNLPPQYFGQRQPVDYQQSHQNLQQYRQYPGYPEPFMSSSGALYTAFDTQLPTPPLISPPIPAYKRVQLSRVGCDFVQDSYFQSAYRPAAGPFQSTMYSSTSSIITPPTSSSLPIASLPPHLPPMPKEDTQRAGDLKRKDKLTIDKKIDCGECNQPLCRLILRGKREDFDVPHSTHYTCLKCRPKPAEGNVKQIGTPSTRVPLNAPFRRKSKRADGSDYVACDVCVKDIACGALIPQDENEMVNIMVEIVCESCYNKYQRCSDCGGGGGNRLGVGKWRCKELFIDGRKTCSLPHVRNGSIDTMEYVTVPVKEIPLSELEEIDTKCSEIFKNSVISSTCIPEVLEHDVSVISCFQDAYDLAEKGWGNFSNMLRVNYKEDAFTRRYLSFRSTSQAPRKVSKASLLKEQDAPTSRILLHPTKTMVGFHLAEWDMLTGTIFLPIVVPWATGETYDATSVLLQQVFKLILDDQVAFNKGRQTQQQPLLPEVAYLWTMVFFKGDSRLLYHLLKKRGFLEIKEFLRLHPEASPKWFYPERSTYHNPMSPVHPSKNDGWTTLVRPLGSINEWGARPRNRNV